MWKLFSGFFLVLFLSSSSFIRAQILPKEGSVLNYRIVGFSFQEGNEVKSPTLEIASGLFNSEDAFRKNIIYTGQYDGTRTIAEVPSFGRAYTWRVTYTNRSKKAASKFYHFSTGMVPEVDTNVTRFRVIQPAEKFWDAYVFMDGTHSLYDMNGHAVWYLPVNEEYSNPVDMHLSPQKTITFLNNEQAYEVDCLGRILWKGPKNGIVGGGTIEHYHHEFTRLSNGHYMALGSEDVVWKREISMLKPKGVSGGQSPMPPPPDMTNRPTQFGTIIEYDESGKVVWSWKSSMYFMNSDLRYYSPNGPMPIVDVHENAFYFDEQAKEIYVSCKGISRILRVQYPEGNVLNSYGEVYRPGVKEIGNGLFCGQHCCRVTNEGDLYLYDNNTCNGEHPLPKILLLHQPKNGKDSLRKIWEYQCTTEGLDTDKLMGPAMPINLPGPARNGLPVSRGGGAVMAMPDQSMFVSMSGPYGKIFIVGRDKKVVWSAVPEKWNTETKEWRVISQYRGSIVIDRKDIEQMVWNSEGSILSKK